MKRASVVGFASIGLCVVFNLTAGTTWDVTDSSYVIGIFFGTLIGQMK